MASTADTTIAARVSAEPQRDAAQSSAGAALLLTLLRPISSLKLTVTLFALGVFLVFAGTLAQVDKGIWTVMEQYFRTPIAWVELKIFFPRAWNVSGSFPYPGGFLIGGLMLVNLIAAHAVRFKIKSEGSRLINGTIVLAAGVALSVAVCAGVFGERFGFLDGYWWLTIQLLAASAVLLVGCFMVFAGRAGIVIAHAGIILMLLSELITALTAIESRMVLYEGEAANWVEDSRTVELAVIDPASKEYVSVPVSRLRTGETISHSDLPFDVRIDQFMVNSDLVRLSSMGADFKNPATTGVGLEAAAIARPEVSGTAAEQTVDAPAAYATLLSKDGGEPLGTYLLSAWRSVPETATIGDKTYDVAVRFKRYYKPYTIRLIDFNHDKYIGTEIPKDYSSFVRLVDPEHDVDREVRIWMNNPLRYRGETFFQASFIQGDLGTILQVVKNPGWVIPYLSCVMVAAGLTAHFWGHLSGFLRRRAAA